MGKNAISAASAKLKCGFPVKGLSPKEPNCQTKSIGIRMTVSEATALATRLMVLAEQGADAAGDIIITGHLGRNDVTVIRMKGSRKARDEASR